MSFRKTFPLVLTACTTLIVLAAIGGWIYVSQQGIAQKDRELQQQKIKPGSCLQRGYRGRKPLHIMPIATASLT